MQRESHQAMRTLRVVLLAASVIFAAIAGCQKRGPLEPPPPLAQSSRSSETDSDFRGEPLAETQEAPRPVASTVDAREPGQQLYARHCAACHGEQGDGRGIAAAYLFPKPRDFQAGRFRLVSTANNVPSRQDLHNVLLRGMPGSSMPPWGHLSQIERDALVDEVMRLRRLGARALYVKLLKEQDELSDEEIAAEDVQQEIQEYVDRFTTPGESSVVPDTGEPTQEATLRAKEIYARSGCLQCHGQEGKGDGVQTMVDDEGYPTAPRDFTAGIFKGGADAASLYRRIAYGMPGTPMPSSQQMTPQQMVDLVHYIRSMSTEEQRQAAVLKREQIVAKAKDPLPNEATDAAWSQIPVISLRMTPLWWRNDADPDLQVQAAHDGKRIAVRVSWQDDGQDVHAARSESFEDALAMELYRGEAEPFLGMGGADAPVDVWFWDADRQSPVDVEDQYPQVVVDIYPFSEKAAATAEYLRRGTSLAEQPQVSLPALATGNQISPGGAPTGGSSLAVGGPGSVTFRIPMSQIVSAYGLWNDGRWTVVMTRSLAVKAPEDGLSLEPGGKASVAFAVWDGSRQDRDGKKLVTIWQDLFLEK